MMIIFVLLSSFFIFFFFNDTATTEIYTLSLHDALPVSPLADRKSFTAASFFPSSACLVPASAFPATLTASARNALSAARIPGTQDGGRLPCADWASDWSDPAAESIWDASD